MRLGQHALFFLLLFSVGAGAAEMYEPDDLKKDFLSAIESYHLDLQKSLGCCFCAFIQNTFGTDRSKFVSMREETLEIASDILRKNGWRPEEFFTFFTEVCPLEDRAGQVFIDRCFNFVEDKSIAVNPKLGSCVLCYQGAKRVLAQPCMHLLYCKSCTEGREFLPNCPTCRGKVTEHLTIKNNSDMCKECKKTPACILASECLHLGLCEQCKEDKKDDICNICNIPVESWQRIYQ